MTQPSRRAHDTGTIVTGTIVTGTGTGTGTGTIVTSASHLRPRDLATLSTAGIRSRPMRAVLSALGIAIGVAAMISVLGISASSQAQLTTRLDSLGTNLLTATSSPQSSGDPVPLPGNAAARLQRLPGIEETSYVADLPDVSVYRSSLVDPIETGGLTVTAASPDLLHVAGARLHRGRWLDTGLGAFPTTVLGHTAAERLGVTEPGTLVWLGGRNTLVVGILEPAPLAPEIDVAALVGEQFATQDLAYGGTPTMLYQRVDPAAVTAVRDLIAPSVQPAIPAAVSVSRPSDALAAVDAVDDTFTTMVIGLGSIALLVGAIGVANTMVITVMERRREIGLRRALGATRRHIRLQFLAEALALSVLGGLAGAALGVLVTAAVAWSNGWPTVVPLLVPVAGVLSTVVVGGAAGLYPAIRAAQTPPNAALSS